MAGLCSFAHDAISQSQFELDNYELLTTYLLNPSQIQSEADITADLFNGFLITRINSYLNYLRIVARANYFVSALNTNFMLYIDQYGGNNYIYGGTVSYIPVPKRGEDKNLAMACDSTNPTTATGFLSELTYHNTYYHYWWDEPPTNSSLVSGFFAACTPLEALLQSTLDCFYDADCLQLLSDQFSLVNRV